MYYVCTKQNLMRISDIVENSIDKVSTDNLFTYTDFITLSIYCESDLYALFYELG